MAEGGGTLQSIRDGSDADVEFTCTPCEEGNIREEAIKYCPECQEYLCRACTAHHGRQKATRSHKLLSREDASKHDSVSALSTKCLYHPDRCVEMYCSSHDMVYCALCIATEHRSCSGVTKIEDSVKLLRCGHEELKLLQSEMKNIQKCLFVTLEKKQKNIESIVKENEEIKTKIEEVERRLRDHIHKLKGRAVASLDTSYSDYRGILESDVAKISNTIEELEKTTKLLEHAIDMDEIQRVVQYKVAQKLSTDAKKLQKENKLTIDFTESENLSTFLNGLESFGKVIANSGINSQAHKEKFKVKSKKEVNVKINTDNAACKILDLCQLPDGTILLADLSNSNLKCLDNSNTVTDCCVLDDKPTAVCSTGPNNVAVKMANNKIQFVAVYGTNMAKMYQIQIDGGYLCGVAYYFEQLWVSASGCVNVYNMTGKLLKSINKNTRGGNMSDVQHIAVHEHTILVTSNSDGVTCYNMNGSPVTELRDPRLKYSRGVCVSPDGTVFLSGYNSKNIVMFSLDGECLGELVSADTGLGNIVSLCYDNRKDCIIVTTDSSDKIHMLELSH